MPLTNADLDAQLEKIRKVLALAEGASTPGEAEAATQKAEILMAKYGIDRAQLAHTDPRTDPMEWRTVAITAPFASAKDVLLATICDAYSVKAIRLNRKRSDAHGATTVEMVGHRSDLERVEILYTALLLQVATGINRNAYGAGAQLAAYRRSYILAFAAEIGRRLREANRRARQEDADAGTVGTDVVLAERSARVRSAFTDKYPRVRAVTVQSRGTGGADGRAAGARADLGGARVANRARHAIGGR
jgi:hypothetical protein